MGPILFHHFPARQTPSQSYGWRHPVRCRRPRMMTHIGLFRLLLWLLPSALDRNDDGNQSSKANRNGDDRGLVFIANRGTVGLAAEQVAHIVEARSPERVVGRAAAERRGERRNVTTRRHDNNLLSGGRAVRSRQASFGRRRRGHD